MSSSADARMQSNFFFFSGKGFHLGHSDNKVINMSCSEWNQCLWQVRDLVGVNLGVYIVKKKLEKIYLPTL